MRQSFWIEGKMPSLNDIVESAKGRGGRGLGYAKLKRELTEAVFVAVKLARLRPMGRVTIEFGWIEPNTARDPDNVASAKKFILDGLVLAGVLRDDGWKEIAGWTDVFVVGAKKPGVDVTLTETN